MRERVGHGEVGRRGVGDGVRGGARAAGARRRLGLEAWQIGRGRGPRPVRPGGPAVAVRPPELPRPTDAWGRPCPGWAGPSGPRVLVRRPAVRWGARHRLRRAVAGLALAAASATAVVALGLLARAAQSDAWPVDGAAPAVAQGSAPAPVVVTAQPGETV